MINHISLKQKAYIASICAALFLAISFTGIYFPYKKTKVEVSLAGERFSKILIDNFNLNEQIADTISVNLLQQDNQNGNLSRLAVENVEYDFARQIYGFNIHNKKKLTGARDAAMRYPGHDRTLQYYKKHRLCLQDL